MRRVERLSARVELDDSGEELARARERVAAGDSDWLEWLRAYDGGAAFVARLALSVVFDDGTQLQRIDVANNDVWIEKRVHLPQVEQQVADVLAKDFGPVVEALRSRGFEIRARDLDEMLVHVELSEQVVELLYQPSQPEATEQQALSARPSPESETKLRTQELTQADTQDSA